MSMSSRCCITSAWQASFTSLHTSLHVPWGFKSVFANVFMNPISSCHFVRPDTFVATHFHYKQWPCSIGIQTTACPNVVCSRCSQVYVFFLHDFRGAQAAFSLCGTRHQFATIATIAPLATLACRLSVCHALECRRLRWSVTACQVDDSLFVQRFSLHEHQLRFSLTP